MVILNTSLTSGVAPCGSAGHFPQSPDEEQ
jgi:hypothetical protein